MLTASVQTIGITRARRIPYAWMELARFTIAAAVVPQISSLLWWVQAHSTIHFRGWVNAEYCLLLALALLYPSWWTLGALLTELTISLIEPIAHLYYFSLADTVLSFRYLLLLPKTRLIGYVCLLFVYTILCAIILRKTLGDRRGLLAKPLAELLLLCAFIPMTVDLAHGRFRSLPILQVRGDVDLREWRAVRMPAVSLIRGVMSGMHYSSDQPGKPLVSVLAQTLNELPPASKPNIVLILTESWGLARDESLNRRMQLPYRNPAISEEYSVQVGTVPFLGGTTSGETRELCGNSEGRSSRIFRPGYYDSCWPNQLNQVGYLTTAVHGFTPTMFSREEWYREFGFRQSVFLPELERDGAALCSGTFTGACDADVARWIGVRLQNAQQGHPEFIHWVTLNSHLPLPPAVTTLSSEACGEAGIDLRSSLCSWYVREQIVHNSVAQLALTAKLRPTVFVIVGDHAPPFMREELRSRFSQTAVPYVILVPKTIPVRTALTASVATPKQTSQPE